MKYAAFIWKYNCDKTYSVSRDGEELQQFKNRIINAYPYSAGYHIEFITYTTIY